MATEAKHTAKSVLGRVLARGVDLELVERAFEIHERREARRAIDDLLETLRFCVERDPGLKSHEHVMAALSRVEGR